MCRILAYLGEEIPLENLLLKPENSLINQSRAPKLHPLMQLAGWGFGVWSDSFECPERPLIYRRHSPAFFDDNAQTMIPSLRAHTAVAHVRAATYRAETVLADENCHPFFFQGEPWIMVHNGSVPEIRLLQRDLVTHCQPEFLKQIKGTTDSEFFFCLLLSLLNGNYSTDNFQWALEEALKLIILSLKRQNVEKPVKLKLALASAHDLVAVNYGCGFSGQTELQGDWRELRKEPVGSPNFLLSTILEPLYLLQGRNFHHYEHSYDMHCGEDVEVDTVILASEPLTANTDDWLEVPFLNLVRITTGENCMTREIRQLNL